MAARRVDVRSFSLADLDANAAAFEDGDEIRQRYLAEPLVRQTDHVVEGNQVHVRLPPAQLARLDAWIATLADPKPTRPEAIRQILAAAILLGGLDPSPAPKAAARKRGAATR